MKDEDGARREYKVLICDYVGLRLRDDGRPDCSEVRQYIEDNGCVFHEGAAVRRLDAVDSDIHFFYRPDLNTTDALRKEAAGNDYDAVIAAATEIPEDVCFRYGGVRIGTGTGNMQSKSWGGSTGRGGEAPLMNTPGVNSMVTAHMVMKAVLRVLPDLPFEALHERSVAGKFDTRRDLRQFPTEKLEGRRFAVLGYGNIGREVARLASAFGMMPVVYARLRHRDRICADGFTYAASPLEAAMGADLLSVHLGLGSYDTTLGRWTNSGLIGSDILNAMAPGAILINLDRGNLVNVEDLDEAIGLGRIRHATIDADIFSNESSGELSGPLVPYIELAKRHPGRLLLLPHAVADTDHPSRVKGAKQAVDQIVSALRFRRLENICGDIPTGYQEIAGRS